MYTSNTKKLDLIAKHNFGAFDIRSEQLLQIVVENQGRVCYGPTLKDFKGIISNVTIGGNILTNWKMNGVPLSNGTKLTEILNKKRKKLGKGSSRKSRLDLFLDLSKGSMTFWIGTFRTPCNTEAR